MLRYRHGAVAGEGLPGFPGRPPGMRRATYLRFAEQDWALTAAFNRLLPRRRRDAQPIVPQAQEEDGPMWQV